MQPRHCHRRTRTSARWWPTRPPRALATGAIALAGLFAAATAPGEVSAQRQNFPVVRGAQATLSRPPHVFRGNLARLSRLRPWLPGDPIKVIPRRQYPSLAAPRAAPIPRRDPHLDAQSLAPRLPSGRFQEPVLDFVGQEFSGANPPDTAGDVGPSYYIQMINAPSGATFVIYDKSDGSVAAGPTLLGSMGAGNCASGLGDPVVLYDQLAERWFLSEFSWSANVLCVYVSITSDPIAGGWYGYEFATPNFPDYPKYSVWPDAYYVTTNEGNAPPVYALERDKMLTGAAATSQRLTTDGLAGFGFEALTPADLDGPTAPPGGAPGLFARHRDDEAHGGSTVDDFLDIYEMTVDWATPANTTLAQIASLAIGDFDSDLCGLVSFSCVPQPDTSVALDPLREVVMWRLAYRNFGTHETLVGNLATDVNGADHHGIRWFELRRNGGAWSVYQEGTLAPDPDHRWMGAIAMNGAGDIVLGYNVSSSSTYPSLRYTGRFADDPLGTLPRGEHVLVAGSGSNSSNRYGDYSAMSVDPSDDRTFWFTGEYNAASSWSTHIGQLDLGTPGLQFFIAESQNPDPVRPER